MDQASMSVEEKSEVKVYYLRPGFELPDLKEVKKCQEKISKSVYKLSPTVLVKHDSTTDMLEVKNMLFIEQHTSIPIAKIQAAYSTQAPDRLHYPDNGGKPKLRKCHEYFYLFMDIVPGVR
jgi:hypothetical protein